MKTFKTIVFVALLIFHIATVVIISVGKNDLNFLFDLFKQMDLVQYISIAGLILFLIVIFLFKQEEKAKTKLTEKHEQEINQFKAKLYDKKESVSAKTSEKPQAPVEKEVNSKKEAADDDSTKANDTNPQS
jgi:magnesium-transporting ATPase (P-type)